MISRAPAIVGVGATAQGQIPDLSANEIGVLAVIEALADAGIDKSQIDGLITCKPPRGQPGDGVDEDLGQMLGINPAFSSTLEYGGCGFSLHLAAMAISAGLARTILLVYGTNQRSLRTAAAAPLARGGRWAAMAGLVHVAGPAAMAARRHMSCYGTTEEQLGWISVAQREWAALNPRAIFRTPMSIQDYLASPYTANPLRRADLTMISDGGAAVIVTAGERVGEFKTTPVYVTAMAQQSALRQEQDADRMMRPWLGTLAQRLYQRSGLRPADIDIAYFQDATSVWVLQMLEWFGYCDVGEGGPFVAEGHTRPGGSRPVNTNGGQLSEAYMWNWLHLDEAVRQLRGECGERQVTGAGVALHVQTHDFIKGAASILSLDGGVS